MKLVTKRDGRKVPFQTQKVINAISKSGFVPDKLKQKIASEIEAINKAEISVEEIQDLVEKKLMASSYKDAAKEYVRYRYKRELIREHEKLNNSILEIVASKNEYVNEENSNKNPTLLSTQRDYMAGEISKELTERLLLPEEIVEAHKSGLIHVHDMDYFVQNMHNCCLVNLEDMLQNGTVISNTLIEKPHSFSTACNIATQIMAQVASNQFGGQSISLAHLAPFVDISRQRIKKEVVAELDEGVANKEINMQVGSPEYLSYIARTTENRVKTDIKKGIQIIQYQINTLLTTNGQTPFVTVWMYLNEVPEGQTRDDLAMIIEEVLVQRYQGTKNEKGVYISPAFPKLVYALTENNIHEDSKYWYLTKLAAKCTAKRLVPDYVSEKKMLEYKYPQGSLLTILQRRDQWGDETIYGPNPFKNMTDEDCVTLQEAIDHKDQDVISYLSSRFNLKNTDIFPIAYPPMGCRSFLTPDLIHYKTYGRFNQGVTTINLPDVALSALKHNEETGEDKFEAFWKIFDERLELCHRSLQIRHQHLEGTPSDVSPIHWQYGALARIQKAEAIDKLLHDNYSTISLGYAGLYECVKAMTGKSHTDTETKPFAIKIMKHMNSACAKWRAEECVSYSLYGTPIETTTDKFARCLQKRFGKIEGITDHGYVTNSYHVNVREHISAFDKLRFESEFQELSPGGAISYVETSNLDHNIPAVIEVMKFIYDNIIYAELNTKSDYCQACGYDGEIQIVTDEESGKLVWECPNCGNRDQKQMNVARRTCGYIGTNFWAKGRTEEIRDRYVHLGNDD